MSFSTSFCRLHPRPPRLFLWLMAALFLFSGCKKQAPTTWQGYVEGEYLYIGPDSAGFLDQLTVKQGDRVTSGELLFRMDAERQSAALIEAEMRTSQGLALLEDALLGKRPTEIEALQAQIQQAQASLDLSMKTLARQQQLYKQKVIPAEELDQARAQATEKAKMVQQLKAELATAQQGQREHQVEAASANLKALTAATTQAQHSLSLATQFAPADGLVFDTYFKPGEFVAQGRPILSLLPPENVRIRLFIGEPQVARVKLGATATITMDGAPAPVHGRVTFISPQAEFTPPVIYSRDMREKLSYMVEITPGPEAAQYLHPGQPVDVSLPDVVP